MPLSYQPERLRRVSEAREFGRVAVLFGGPAIPRSVVNESLLKTLQVLQATHSSASLL